MNGLSLLRVLPAGAFDWGWGTGWPLSELASYCWGWPSAWPGLWTWRVAPSPHWPFSPHGLPWHSLTTVARSQECLKRQEVGAASSGGLGPEVGVAPLLLYSFIK